MVSKRSITQALSTLAYNLNFPGFASGRIYQGSAKQVCLPGLNCYSCPGAVGACPLGALQSALSGTVLRIPFYVLGVLLLFGMIGGRFICGWLCPFGWLQDLLYRLPTPKLRHVPGLSWLQYVRYVIAGLFVLVLPLAAYGLTGVGEPAFCKYICPAGTLEAAVPLLLLNRSLAAAAGWITAWKFFLLFLFLISMVFIYRPFCRFICPLGVWYGFFNKRAALGIAVHKKRCTKCGACARVCPMEVKRAGTRECISCGICQKACATKAIYFRNPIK